MTKRVKVLAVAAAMFAAGAAISGHRAQAADTPRTTANGLYTAAQSARGKAAYAQHCASCHGEALGGQMAPTLTGAFWTAWQGRTMGELYGIVQGSMPQQAPASLPASDYADIVAYMLQAGGYPAGTAELPADETALEPVTIGKRP